MPIVVPPEMVVAHKVKLLVPGSTKISPVLMGALVMPVEQTGVAPAAMLPKTILL